MSNYKLDDVFEFYVSTKSVGSEYSEKFTLEDLGFYEYQLDEDSDSEIESEIDNHYMEWLRNNINTGFKFKK